ncbi:hypothetical protein X772_05835 [Mesorhizobium sp. LSJC280B00]|nr:hypothetical protein X772_05835 [Mesorhizobium sp. LSJC280B00]
MYIRVIRSVGCAMNAASLHTAGPAVRTKIGQIGYFMGSCAPSSRTMYAAKLLGDLRCLRRIKNWTMLGEMMCMSPA